MSDTEDLAPISDRLDMVIDVAIDYAMSTLAGGERLQPAEAWEAGMARAVVIAQEYEPDPGADSEAGAPHVRPIGLQLEVGTTAPLWGARL